MPAARVRAARTCPLKTGEGVRLQVVRYTSHVAFEAVLREALKMPAEDRAELIERLIDSLDDNEVKLSAEEATQLDEALADADRAAERGELIPHHEVLAQMRQIS